MRFHEIVAEKKTQRVITVYHGTSPNKVRSILKHGLVANPKDKTYDGGLESVGGVYTSASKSYALDMGAVASDKDGSDHIALVTMQFVTGSAGMDEDMIGEILKSTLYDDEIEPIFLDIKRFLKDSDIPKYLTRIAKSFAKEALQHFKRNKLGQVNKMTKEYLTKYLLAVLTDAREIYWSDVTKFKNMFSPFTVSKFDHRDLLQKAMDSMRANADNSSDDFFMGDEGPANFRLNRDVKFKGKTRITSIDLYDARFNFIKNVFKGK